MRSHGEVDSDQRSEPPPTAPSPSPITLPKHLNSRESAVPDFVNGLLRQVWRRRPASRRGRKLSQRVLAIGRSLSETDDPAPIAAPAPAPSEAASTSTSTPTPATSPEPPRRS